MSQTLNKVVVHVNESVDQTALANVERGVCMNRGVISAGHRPEQNHLLVVEYDSEIARATDILHSLQEHGLHAQLLGM